MLNFFLEYLLFRLCRKSGAIKVLPVFLLMGVCIILPEELFTKTMIKIIKVSRPLSNGILRLNGLNESVHYLCPVMTGRLGNHMFILAASYLIAKKLNMPLVISSRGKDVLTEFSQNFEMKVFYMDTPNVCSFFPASIYTFKQTVDNLMISRIRRLNASVGIFSYFQSYKNFDNINHAEVVRNLFKFSSGTKKIAQTVILQSAKLNYPQRQIEEITFVGVHIRRGDILMKKHGYRAATFTYLQKAFTYFNQTYRNVLFIVRTNDETWTKKTLYMIKKSHQTFKIAFPPRYNSTIDLAILASCNHSIITLGTFSWWSGWLSGGQVIYFKDAAIKGSEYAKFLRRNSYFPRNWIGMT